MQTTPVVRIRNASEQALALIQSEFPNYHPLIALARLAHDHRVLTDPKLELDVHKTILPYVAPKLSSVEVKAENPDKQRVIVSLFDERQTLDNDRVVDVQLSLCVDAEDIVPLNGD